IGSNRADAAETVAAILDDFRAGILAAPARDRTALTELVRQRRPEMLDRTAWQAIDRAERAAGAAAGRPRIKLATVGHLLATARGGRSSRPPALCPRRPVTPGGRPAGWFRAPADLTVIGFDERRHAALWDPAFTTVRIDATTYSRRAAR